MHSKDLPRSRFSSEFTSQSSCPKPSDNDDSAFLLVAVITKLFNIGMMLS